MLPSAAPTASVARITSRTGSSSTNRKNSAAKLHKAKIAPTLRSMPPVIRQNAMPSATKPNSANSRSSDSGFCTGVVGDGQAEINQQADHHGERDDRLEPLLQQQFRQARAAAKSWPAPRPKLVSMVRRHQRDPVSGQLPPCESDSAASGVAINLATSAVGAIGTGDVAALLRQSEAVTAVGVALSSQTGCV